MSDTTISGPIVVIPQHRPRPPINLAPMAHGDSAAALASSIGRETADLAAILFMLPMLERVRLMIEAEIQDEVAGLFGDADLDPAECENCRLVASLAFDRRLALHTRSQQLGGRA